MSASNQPVRVLACRFEEPLHAQLVAVARLEGVTLVDVVRQAVYDYLERRKSDGSLAAKAEIALAEIEREAAERRQAIEGLLTGMGESGSPKGGRRSEPKPTSGS